MKQILGHKSWTYAEIVEMLEQHGNFTMCSLPHYRYNRVQIACQRLKRKGWIEKSGRTDTSINWRATDKFKHDRGLDLV